MGKCSNILQLMALLALIMLGGCGTDDPPKGGALDRSFNASSGYAILQSIAGVSTGVFRGHNTYYRQIMQKDNWGTATHL